MKKFILMLLTLVFVCALFGVQENKTYAEDGLEVIKTHTGSDLTYRGTNEKVYRLSEYNYPTNQLRAAWVTVFAGDISGYTSETQFKEMMNNVLDDMDRMGMNAIVFHVRTHNNALYKSELNPLASWWSNVNFDEFDPLEWLIEECHSRGIEFHAWLNPYRVSGNGTNSQYAAEPLPAVNLANDESNLLKVGSNVIFDPGIPEVRDFIVDTCMELIENYDVDAIHFDDYFYISGANDAETREKYNTENLSIGDFRRKQVDLFIEALSNEIRAYNAENNKTVQLGISPSGIYKNGSYQATPTYDSNGNLISPTYSNTSGFAHYDDYLYSDTLNWINHEWIDYIMPQCYWAIEHSIASFVELTKFEGTNSRSNKSQTLIYNKEGEITEIIDFKDNKEYKVSTYSYENNSTLEKVSDKTAKSSEIDEIETSYDKEDDYVNYRKFYVNNKLTAEFDFNSQTAYIGKNKWNFDNGTFVCNDDLIGSEKYSGTINGQEVRFDVLKTGYCVEYIGNNGEVESRKQFDTKGNLISIE